MNDIAVILTSSVIAAGLTSFVNWLIQKKNYRAEYHKKLVDNRMKAYEGVWELLLQFPYRYDWDDPDFDPYDRDEKGLKNYYSIRNKLESLAQNGYWFSFSMQTTIIDFYKLVEGLNDPFNDVHNEPVERMVKNDRQIGLFRTRLVSIYYLDMEQMYDVDLFFKEKRRNPVVHQPTWEAFE
jgi:hypothetical protein